MPTSAPARRPTSEPLTGVIATRVRELRRHCRLSQDDLAKRMDALGVPWTRATVVNLETRATGSRSKAAGRDSVSVGELFALASVFGVPPVWLLADVESGEPTPITKGLAVDAWSTLLWAAGRQPLSDDPGIWWHRVAPAIATAFACASAIDQVRRNQAASVDLEDLDGRAERDRSALRVLAANLTTIAMAGLVLPPVPKDIHDRATELGVDLPSAPQG
jgi:transcriptional regulator with XRE-family HTH domain